MTEQANLGRMHYINQINKQLGSLAYDAKISSTGNRNDTAVISENTICGLLNRIKGWNLKNANVPNHPNYPAVDLIDEAAQVAVQITLENKVTKVDDMLAKFKKHKLNRTFKHLILLVITLDKPTPAMTSREDGCFYGEEDIWNIPRLMREIEGIEDVDRLKEIDAFLSKEIGRIMSKCEENSSAGNTSAKLKRTLPRSVLIGIFATLLVVLLGGFWMHAQYRHHMELRNTLMKNGFVDAEAEQQEYAFNTQAKRCQVGTITFLDSLELVPNYAVDASQLQNGTVKAWATEHGNLYDIYIAADGDIDAPDDSSNLFREMVNLTKIEFRDAFSTRNVESMNSMFKGCQNLKKLDISFFDTAQVTDLADMFSQCSNLTELNIVGFDTSNVANMARLFYGCSALTKLDLSDFNTANVTNMCGMFCDCPNLKTLNIRDLNTANVTNMSFMFARCRSLAELDLMSFDTSMVTDMSYMFQCCESLTQLDVSKFDTSNVTDMSQMFRELGSVAELDMAGFDTANVTNMFAMFYKCADLKRLDLSNFNTQNVVNMSYMFSRCDKLAELNVSSFDTSNVTDMSKMFSSCSSLTGLDLNSFDTSNVINMSGMFETCMILSKLELNHFVTNNVIDVSSMFFSCPNLNDLNIDGWDLSSVIEYSEFMDPGITKNGQPWEELFSHTT